jgi:hypothetical protein
MQESTREQLAMPVQLTALDNVIAMYDPAYVPEEPRRRSGRPRNEGQVTNREINALLSNVNKRRAVLETLRDAMAAAAAAGSSATPGLTYSCELNDR